MRWRKNTLENHETNTGSYGKTADTHLCGRQVRYGLRDGQSAYYRKGFKKPIILVDFCPTNPRLETSLEPPREQRKHVLEDTTPGRNLSPQAQDNANPPPAPRPPSPLALSLLSLRLLLSRTGRGRCEGQRLHPRSCRRRDGHPPSPQVGAPRPLPLALLETLRCNCYYHRRCRSTGKPAGVRPRRPPQRLVPPTLLHRPICPIHHLPLCLLGRPQSAHRLVRFLRQELPLAGPQVAVSHHRIPRHSTRLTVRSPFTVVRLIQQCMPRSLARVSCERRVSATSPRISASPCLRVSSSSHLCPALSLRL